MGNNTIGNKPTTLPKQTGTVGDVKPVQTPITSESKPDSTSTPRGVNALEYNSLEHNAPSSYTGENTAIQGGDRSGVGGILPFQVAQRLDVAKPAIADVASGPKGPARPEVTALLATYGHQRLGRPAERLTQWAAKTHDMISGAANESGGNVSKVVDAMVDKDVRRQVFLLEGGLKFYKKAYPEMEPLLVQSKALEDLLGQVKGTSTMVALATEKGAPKAVLDVLNHHAASARTDLEALVQKEWMPDGDGKLPAVSNFLDTMADISFAGYGEDKKFVRKEFSRRLENMKDVPYDMGELQGDFGVHELRRNLRWIPIYAEALDGLVQTDDKNNPVKAYKPLLNLDLANSKYLKLPDAGHEKKPVAVSKSLYTANMQLISGFGALKDRGEEIEEIALAYQEAGLASDYPEAEAQALDLLGLDHKEPKRLTKEAKTLFDGMKENKLFKAMRKDYKG